MPNGIDYFKGKAEAEINIIERNIEEIKADVKYIRGRLMKLEIRVYSFCGLITLGMGLVFKFL